MRLDIQNARWCIPAGNFAVWRELNDISVLFDRRSGQTHLLDAFARELYDLITEQADTAPELTSRMAAILEGAVDPALRQKIDDTIAEFDQLGLIFPELTEPTL